MPAETDISLANILLVDDDPADILLTKRAIKNSRVYNELHIVKDGVEAMAFLRREREYADANRPDLILLDLNMPKKDGRETLADIKADEDLRTIPVVILTTSDAELDIVRSYELQANCFITKPVDLERFTEAIQTIESFLLCLVSRPEN